jgi:Ca2+-binding RTX toxin-like protein
MNLSALQFAGSFSYYADGSRSNPVSYIFSKDINRDGIDEVFFVSFETQPNTPQNYSNTSVHIFGWKNNLFQEITAQWLPGSTNLVEGVGDVAFGDFNGDGQTDVFLSAYTDMVHPVNAYQLINRGTYFEKVSLGLQTWMHAVASADINKDGFDDVLAAGYSSFPQYLGSSKGLVKYQGMVGSSGLALGDFLGNGTISAIYVDAGSGTTDTFLYRIDVNASSQSIGLQKIATLPGPRLAALGLDTSTASSHDIRARSIDFNGDGLLDVLVFSYLADYSKTLQQNDHKSEIQFLLNNGQGKFTDVTDQYRINYDVKGYVGYYPQVIDFNLDGLPDIFSSNPDWMPSYNSTALLLQQQTGKYVDTHRDLFRANVTANKLSQSIIATGPDNTKYLVSEGKWDWSTPTTKVYLQSLNFPERNEAETLSGTALDDVIYGLGGNDLLIGKKGNDSIDGGIGVDTAQFTGTASEYTVRTGPANAAVLDKTISRDGTDTLTNIERLKFSDTNIALDIGATQNAGSVYCCTKPPLIAHPMPTVWVTGFP